MSYIIHFLGFTGLSRGGSWETVETQLKLAGQKWKARCKISRRQQLWQDNIDVRGNWFHQLWSQMYSVFFGSSKLDIFAWQNSRWAVHKGCGGEKDAGKCSYWQHKVSDQGILQLLSSGTPAHRASSHNITHISCLFSFADGNCHFSKCTKC